jgi:hypothetical protein
MLLDARYLLKLVGSNTVLRSARGRRGRRGHVGRIAFLVLFVVYLGDNFLRLRDRLGSLLKRRSALS